MFLHGGIDLLDRHGVQGWAYDPKTPETPVTLLIKVNGQAVTSVMANLFRADLEKAGYGNGRHGFAIKLEGLSTLQPQHVELVRESDGALLPGTPRTLAAEAELNDSLLDMLSGLLSQAESAEVCHRWAAFLAVQADTLLQRRADKLANKPSPASPREFRVRWTGLGPPPKPDPAPRALVIDETLPDENRDAGSRAIFSHVRSLRRLGFDVVFAPSDMRGGNTAPLESEGVECCSSPWCASVEEVLRRQSQSFALVYIHRGTNTRYIPLIRHYQPRARLIYSVADLHFIRLARQAEVEERPELKEVSQRVRLAEIGAARASDAVITHSTFEAELLSRELPAGRTHLVPWSVPAAPVETPWAERAGVAFIGSYGHPPNLDAAWYLIQDVMPLVRADNQQIECILAGSGMPEPLREVVSPGVRALGFVDDLRSLQAKLRLTVAPLTFGAGLKGKVLDSLAAGLPCACSTVAAEGMEFTGELEQLVAPDAAGLAALIVRLHEDEAFNRAMAEAGLAYVRERLSDERVDAAMRAAAGLRS